MNYRLFVAQAVLYQLLLAILGFAQPSPTDSTIAKTEFLNQIVVSENRSENLLFQTPSSISVLDQTYLKTTLPRTVPEALMGINGVFVQKTNHGGGSPFLRGLTGNQTLILIDGIRLNNSTFRYGPNQYLNTIDPFSVAKIEVLKGSGSVQYGTDAIGGTIQLFTAEPDFDTKLKLNLWSKIATQKMEHSVRGELSYGKSKYAISGNFGVRNFGDLVGGISTRTQSPSGYSEQAANLKTKINVGRGVLTLAHQYFEAQNVPIYHKIVLENFALNEIQTQRRQLTYLKFEQKNDHRLFKKLNIIASSHRTYENRVSQKNNSTKITQELDKVLTNGLTANINSELADGWSANSGVEVYYDKVRSSKTDKIGTDTPKNIRGLYPDKATFLNYSFYTLHQFAQKRWLFSAGLRANGFVIDVPDPTVGGPTIGNTKLHPFTIVPNLSALFSINSKSNIYASYNAGFRAPNIDDLGTLGIVDFRYEIPTNDLKSEKSYHYELGYKYKSRKFSATSSLFYCSLNNLITRIKVPNQVIDGYDVYQKENIERAYIRGYELEIEIPLSHLLVLYGNVCHSFGQNISKNEPMRRMPPFNGRLGLDYHYRHFYLRPEFLFAAKQNRLAQGDIADNRIGPNGTAAWQLINIYSGYHYKWLNIHLSLQNLTNKDYRTHGSGINGVGRSAWLMVQVEI